MNDLKQRLAELTGTRRSKYAIHAVAYLALALEMFSIRSAGPVLAWIAITASVAAAVRAVVLMHGDEPLDADAAGMTAPGRLPQAAPEQRGFALAPGTVEA